MKLSHDKRGENEHEWVNYTNILENNTLWVCQAWMRTVTFVKSPKKVQVPYCLKCNTNINNYELC